MKKVLLSGDSIRLRYQPLVKEKLDGLADVSGPADNCRFVNCSNKIIDQYNLI